LSALRRKMTTSQPNGASLCWLLIPEQWAVEVWVPAGEAADVRQRMAPTNQIVGSPLFPGLLIDLQEVWAV